jgi:hypothetical protein
LAVHFDVHGVIATVAQRGGDRRNVRAEAVRSDLEPFAGFRCVADAFKERNGWFDRRYLLSGKPGVPASGFRVYVRRVDVIGRNENATQPSALSRSFRFRFWSVDNEFDYLPTALLGIPVR